jgi:protease-4
MIRTAKAFCAAALLLAALATRAQVSVRLDRARGLPVGLAVPGDAAGAEEPTALSVNPAGAGFVDGVTFEYSFEDGNGHSLTANGAWLSVPLGPLVPTLALEWVTPGNGPRYLKTGFGLALAAGQVFSMGWAWNWWSSPDPGLDSLFSMDGGITVRPIRQLSIGASVLGLEGRLSGQPLPVRYDLGLGLRVIDDALTVGADLLANDEAKGSFHVTHVAASAEVVFRFGLVLRGQALIPLRSGQSGADGATGFQLAVGFDQPHLGLAAATGALHEPGQDASSWIYGLRASAQRYRGPSLVRTVQVLDLGSALEPASPIAAALLGADRDRYGTLLRRLREIRNDPSVAALIVKISRVPGGAGRSEEIRAALASVRERKPVIAWLGFADMNDYLVATAATEIVAPPGSIVAVNGIASTSLYLEKGLGKLGIAFEAVVAGRYKSAPEILTRSDMSAADREQRESVVGDLFDRQVKAIAAARRLPEVRVRELVDQGVFTSGEAMQAGLVDETLWPDEVEERARERFGGLLAHGLDESPPRAAQRWGPRPYVAVIRIQGAIASGRSRTDPFGRSAIAGAETIARLVHQVAADGEAKAIVVRIDSPGGDGFASDLIWRALSEARRKKPVIASMGDVAASGGYLVAMGADAVLAQPSTITGSIGVFALKPDLSGLLEKIAVSVGSVQRGSKARIESPLKPWTPEERKLVERQVQAFYREFLSKVAEARHLSREEVEQVASGRVWTGEQARSRRLVDRLGTLADAIALARERAGRPLDDDLEVRRVEPATGLFEDLSAGIEAQAAAGSALPALAARVPEIGTAFLLSEMGPVLALPTSWVLAGEP